MLADFAGLRVLLLQGPNGPFFRRVARGLEEVGAIPLKINLNFADWLFFRGRRVTNYRGTFEDFPAFLERYLAEERIDVVFLFGDGRPYHRAAIPLAERLGVEVFVFEEGYLRPNHVTVERGGVNARSPMPRDPDAYRGAPVETQRPREVRRAFAWSVLYTILNSLGVSFGRPFFPHYRHHRDVRTWVQAFLWARGFLRRAYYARPERWVLERCAGPWRKRYFLVGLQVHSDSQVRDSRFSDVTEFIEEVVRTFAEHASTEDRLVVKHHPADRAYRDYGELCRRLAARFGLGERLLYVHDLHLPTLLRHARGTVVINSTVGLSSIHHGTPVHALGDAVYARMGLAATGSLGDFFRAPPEVDRARYQNAYRYLVHTNQANGSIWVPLATGESSGLFWPPGFVPRKRAPGAGASSEVASAEKG